MENKIKKEYLQSYGIYDWQAFAQSDIEIFGFSLDDERYSELGDTEYLNNIYIVGKFIEHFKEFESTKEKYKIGSRNLFDDIKEFFGEKFGIYDFSAPDELPQLIHTCLGNYDKNKKEQITAIKISWKNINTSPKGDTIKQVFDFMEICTPEIPKTYFDNKRLAFTIVFNIDRAERDIGNAGLDWKKIITDNFNQFKDKQIEFRKDSDNVVELLLPLAFFKENFCYNKIEIKLNGSKLRWYIEDDTYEAAYFMYKEYFQRLFYKITGVTTYEWILRALQNNVFDSEDEDLPDMLKDILPELKIWHRKALCHREYKIMKQTLKDELQKILKCECLHR